MSTYEYIFTFLISLTSLVFLYKSLFKNNTCNSCGCSSSKKNNDKRKIFRNENAKNC